MKVGSINPVETIEAGSATRHAMARLTVETPAPGFTELTGPISAWVAGSGIRHGLLTVYCRHTSASLTIQENADPDVQRDLMTALDRLAPRDAPYTHTIEGPDDMPSHVRAMLTGASVAIPVVDGRPGLGTWQGIFLIEHRDAPHRREIVLHIVGA